MTERHLPGGFESLAVLVAVNLVPLFGAAFWGWSIFEIVVLYWMENLVIGAINVLKMATAAPNRQAMSAVGTLPRQALRRPPEAQAIGPSQMAVSPVTLSKAHHGLKLFLIPFFAFHYGMFCLVHGVFVFTLLGQATVLRGGRGGPFEEMSHQLPEILANGGYFFVAAVAGSHLWSFFANFIWRGEYRLTTAMHQMAAPYGRIVVLHIAILAGAFAIAALGSPLPLLALLIAGKIVLDAGLHVRSHRKAGGLPAPAPSKKN